MMTLEQAAATEFTKRDLRWMWLQNLPLGYTWGPERGFLTKQALLMGIDDEPEMDLEMLPATQSPNAELCGAMIRADACGYASPGRPGLAAALAWRDASLTYRSNGIYGAMFARGRNRRGLRHRRLADDRRVRPRGRAPAQPFRRHRAGFDRPGRGGDGRGEEAYRRIHGRYGEYGHCRVFQETGTMINTLRFADSVGDGICIQVSQGNDTDSYGATAGAILGVKFGPGHLEERWLAPFHDTVHHLGRLFTSSR